MNWNLVARYGKQKRRYPVSIARSKMPGNEDEMWCASVHLPIYDDHSTTRGVLVDIWEYDLEALHKSLLEWAAYDLHSDVEDLRLKIEKEA